MELKKFKQKLVELNQQQKPAAQNKPVKPNNTELRQKLNAAKSTLGIKDLNVAAAASGHEKVNKAAAKNSNAQFNQILNKLSPNERKNYIAATSHVPSDSLSPNVSMSRFRRQLQTLRGTGAKPLMNSYDILDTDQITESVFKDEMNPPPMIVMKRKGIRIFPDGRKVALYQNSQLGLVVTIPYSNAQTAPLVQGVQTEEVEAEEIMESLEQVAAYAQQENPKSTARHMRFADGSKLKVSHGAAKAIHMVHGALNDENKKKFADMLKDPKGFTKAAHFALSKVDFTINKK